MPHDPGTVDPYRLAEFGDDADVARVHPVIGADEREDHTEQRCGDRDDPPLRPGLLVDEHAPDSHHDRQQEKQDRNDPPPRHDIPFLELPFRRRRLNRGDEKSHWDPSATDRIARVKSTMWHPFLRVWSAYAGRRESARPTGAFAGTGASAARRRRWPPPARVSALPLHRPGPGTFRRNSFAGPCSRRRSRRRPGPECAGRSARRRRA